MKLAPSEPLFAPQVCAGPLSLLLFPAPRHQSLLLSHLAPDTLQWGFRLFPSMPRGSSQVTQAGHIGHGCLWDREEPEDNEHWLHSLTKVTWPVEQGPADSAWLRKVLDTCPKPLPLS